MSLGRYGTDLLVIGAGIVGAAVAHYAAGAGLRVTVVDRGGVAGGTTGAGEGNLLVSDKQPGPELALAQLSTGLWRDLADQLGPVIEYEPKGGLVVAAGQAQLATLNRLAAKQSAVGVSTEAVTDLAAYEPHLASGLAGGVFYPQDAQVMPALAAAALLRHRRITVRLGVTVTGTLTSYSGRLIGVTTTDGHYSCGTVVNASGPWAGELSQVLGAPIPIGPRRGFVLVTEPVPKLVRHKVYTCDYVDDVASDASGLQTSPVVEGTAAGPILIGASREHVGFDSSTSVPVLRSLAAGAVRLFPKLAQVSVMRAYCGFRPYSPDHLPVIGPDPRIPGLWHATGHEGAGVGLAPATGHLIVQSITEGNPDMDISAFRPERLAQVGT